MMNDQTYMMMFVYVPTILLGITFYAKYYRKTMDDKHVEVRPVFLELRWLYDNAAVAEECIRRMNDLDQKFEANEKELIARISRRYFELHVLMLNMAKENATNN